jgi:uncharacterized cysteine cluster protein YcgN (CxxCxxCC family)
MKYKHFWEKPLQALTAEEWEALCDGCGKCCLIKLQDEDTDAVVFTEVACRLLNLSSCRCGNYPQRKEIVPDCVILSSETIAGLYWMPSTCAYRLRAENKPLPGWHPLLTGDPDSVHRAGISIRGRVLREQDVPDHALGGHIVDWPE